MDIYQIIDDVLAKYLKKNEDLTEKERDTRNQIIVKVYTWYEMVGNYIKENGEADVKEYNNRHGR